MVTHESSDKGDGVWKCNCNHPQCQHLGAAKKYLQQEEAEESADEDEDEIDKEGSSADFSESILASLKYD